MYRPLFIALALSAILATTPAAAVSLSGACESIANVGAQAARQRDAGVSLRESLADVADFGKPGNPASSRSRANAAAAKATYTAAVRVAYSSSRLTPEEIFHYVDAKCMGSEYVKRDDFSMAPSVPQTIPVAADIARMQAEIDAKMQKMQDDNAAQWASTQAKALQQQEAEATRKQVEAAKDKAVDEAKTAHLNAEWAARDQRAAAQRAIQAEVPARPTFWEILAATAVTRSYYSTSCYTSSYGGKRHRSTYTRCY